MHRIVVWMAVAMVTGGCASHADGERRPRPSVKGGEFGTAACFPRHSIHDFKILDDRNLIIFAPGKSDAYHVQVSPPAAELRFADALGFESHNSRICGIAGDELIIPDAVARRSYRSVTGVYRLDAPALEGLQGRFGPGPVPGKQTPQQGEGAAIERELDLDADQ